MTGRVVAAIICTACAVVCVVLLVHGWNTRDPRLTLAAIGALAVMLTASSTV